MSKPAQKASPIVSTLPKVSQLTFQKCLVRIEFFNRHYEEKRAFVFKMNFQMYTDIVKWGIQMAEGTDEAWLVFYHQGHKWYRSMLEIVIQQPLNT